MLVLQPQGGFAQGGPKASAVFCRYYRKSLDKLFAYLAMNHPDLLSYNPFTMKCIYVGLTVFMDDVAARLGCDNILHVSAEVGNVDTFVVKNLEEINIALNNSK